MLRLKYFAFGLTIAFIGIFRPEKITEMMDTYAKADELKKFKEKIAKVLKVDEINI